MLNKLSLRNAKRQSGKYVLYFLTLTCAVSFLYSFNALIFSEILEDLYSLEVLPYMIIFSSLLIVCVIGWLVSYMTNYMLKERSKEFSIYFLTGIEKKTICSLIYRENSILGIIAYVIGILMGIPFSHFLEIAVAHMFGREYVFAFRIHVLPILLTLLYFFVILWFSLIKNRKWIKRVKVIDLLYSNKKNENRIFTKTTSMVKIFGVSILFGLVGIFIIFTHPFGKGLDVLLSVFFLIGFLYGLFVCVPSFLFERMKNCYNWKYKRNRLIFFRSISSKIRSMSIIMGTLSILFMLSITFMGMGITVDRIANKNLELCPFDIMILHNKSKFDFSSYDLKIKNCVPVKSSHSYAIYTNRKTTFHTIYSNALSRVNAQKRLNYVEFQYDTFMRQSDYIKLRDMLGLKAVELSPQYCYIHCLDTFSYDFEEYIGRTKEDLSKDGFIFTENFIFTEPFYQTEAYGNGFNYIIIVPDQLTIEMDILYSLYAAVTDIPLDNGDLSKIVDDCNELIYLDRSMGKSIGEKQFYTSLLEDKDYIFGKWIEKGKLSHLYSMIICLFYLAIILEIIGATILSVHIISDKEKKRKQDIILYQFGMEKTLIKRLNAIQLVGLFVTPTIPAFILSGYLIFICAKEMEIAAFQFAMFNGSYWILQNFFISVLFFGIFYLIYLFITRLLIKNR